uniref:Myelin and lymphocyte protein-like n=1 Tax=Gadus morhua TaxID=8049 RepID=A0A8C5AQ07_GADMO
MSRMASTSADVLPTGSRIFTSIPDIFFIPEFVFGGLVWTLVASTLVDPTVSANPLGWVMFVSIFCFVMTTLWFFIFACGANQGGIWPSLVRHILSSSPLRLSSSLDSSHPPSLLSSSPPLLSASPPPSTPLILPLSSPPPSSPLLLPHLLSSSGLQDVAYHFVAVLLYLSASVALAYVTVMLGTVASAVPVLPPSILKIYRLDIAAVVRTLGLDSTETGH